MMTNIAHNALNLPASLGNFWLITQLFQHIMFHHLLFCFMGSFPEMHNIAYCDNN